MKSYKRKVPAARSQERGFAKFTDKQLAVYYWLISQAYYNSQERESHYFIYKKDICYSQVARELGIGSVNTVKAAIKKLDDYCYINVSDDVIRIPHKDYYTYLNINLIRFLLGWAKQLGAEILLYYSVLKRYFELNAQNGSKTIFNTKLMVKLLGHNAEDKDAYYKFRLYLAFLREYGLIEVTESIKEKQGGKYISYTLWDIKETVTEKCGLLEENKLSEINLETYNKIKNSLDYNIE